MGRKIGRERQRLTLSAREVTRGVGYFQKSENAAVADSASRSKIQLEEPDEESQLSSSTPSAKWNVENNKRSSYRIERKAA